MRKLKFALCNLMVAITMSVIRINAAIDISGLKSLINEYFNDFYKVLVGITAVVVTFYIAKDIVKFWGADDEDKEWKDLVKKVAKKVVGAIAVLILPQILRLLGIA